MICLFFSVDFYGWIEKLKTIMMITNLEVTVCSTLSSTPVMFGLQEMNDWQVATNVIFFIQ